MNNAIGNDINLTTGFNIKDNRPIDSRLIVNQTTDLISIDFYYEGMCVYVKSTKTYYTLTASSPTNSANWKPMAFTSQVVGLSYKGSWDANTNTPNLVTATPTNGHYYIVSVDGPTLVGGNNDWQAGDWIIGNGTSWQKIDASDRVNSVAGKTGSVVLEKADITDFNDADYATAAQGALADSATQPNDFKTIDGNDIVGVGDIPLPAPTTVLDNLTSTSTTSALSASQGKVLKDKQDEGVLVENLTGTQSKRVLLGKKIKFSGATVQANGDDAEVVIESKTPLRVYLKVGANNAIAEEGNPSKPFADLYYWYRYFYSASITYMEVILLGNSQTFNFNGSFVNAFIDPAGTVQLGDNFISTKFISLGANTLNFNCSTSVNKQVFFTYDAFPSVGKTVYFDMPTSSINITDAVLGQFTYGRNPIYIDCKNFSINSYAATDHGSRGITVYVNRIRCNQINTVRSVNSNYPSLYAHEILDVNNVNNIDTVQIYAPASGSEYRPTYMGVGFLFPKVTSRQTIIKNISTTTSTRLGAESGYTIYYIFENTVITNSKLQLQLQVGSDAQGTTTYSGNIVSSVNGVDFVRPAGSISGTYTLRDLTLNSGVIGAFTWDFKSNGTLRIINSIIYASQKLFTFLTSVNIEIINSTILVGSANYVMSGTDSATNNIKIINSVTDGLGWIEAPSTLMVKQILGSTPTA